MYNTEQKLDCQSVVIDLSSSHCQTCLPKQVSQCQCHDFVFLNIPFCCQQLLYVSFFVITEPFSRVIVCVCKCAITLSGSKGIIGFTHPFILKCQPFIFSRLQSNVFFYYYYFCYSMDLCIKLLTKLQHSLMQMSRMNQLVQFS